MTGRPGFHGFRRPDGRVGVRNHVLVVPTVVCAAVVTERIAAQLPVQLTPSDIDRDDMRRAALQ